LKALGFALRAMPRRPATGLVGMLRVGTGFSNPARPTLVAALRTGLMTAGRAVQFWIRAVQHQYVADALYRCCPERLAGGVEPLVALFAFGVEYPYLYQLV
jgi:hypothetical protein